MARAGRARIGFEIEFFGLDARKAAEVAAEAVGGHLRVEATHRATLLDSAVGKLKFTLDTRFAGPAAAEPGLFDRALDGLELRETAADLLAAFVPVEMITEPLSRDRFEAVDRIIGALRAAGAAGTGDSPVSAFGLHLNVELDPLDGARAIRIAAAYAFVEPWLRAQMGLDLARRVTPFIDPYPADYVTELATLFATGEPPGMAAFIALYGIWNPTRNRGLDLWPLLGAFDLDAATEALGEPVKNPRPAFHYRLPDSRLSEPGWTPAGEVARWDAVERLADDEAAFAAVRDAWLDLAGWRVLRSGYEARVAGALGAQAA